MIIWLLVMHVAGSAMPRLVSTQAVFATERGCLEIRYEVEKLEVPGDPELYCLAAKVQP